MLFLTRLVDTVEVDDFDDSPTPEEDISASAEALLDLLSPHDVRAARASIAPLAPPLAR